MPHIDLRTDLFGITSLLDYRPQAAGPLCDLTHLLLRGPSTLTEAERELIATYVSYLNDCIFCSNAHGAAVCELSGGFEKTVRNLKDILITPDLSEKMKALLLLAGSVQNGGTIVTKNNVESARMAGATDLEIHDTVLIAALFCLYNRYVDGLHTTTPSESAYYAALAKRITTRGYRKPENGYQALEF